jgi:uncharacterized protein
MQYIVMGYDGTDEEAIERRLKVREQHLKGVEANQEAGRHLYGGAILDESGKMIGSMMVVNYDSKEELEKWLENEPYVVGGVWQKLEVKPFKVAPMFTKK